MAIPPALPATFIATAYGPPWNAMQGTGVTATGVNLQGGSQKLVVAVDPSVIPLGTKLKFNPNPFGNGNLVFTAADTGGAIKRNKIDFFIASGRAAQLGWGTKTVTATVVGTGGATDVATLGQVGSTSPTPGGSAGAGGSGALTNEVPPSPFTVGDTQNPNEDFWTAINRIAMERYWYCFSDGETLYLADGPDLMKQTPATSIDRLGDVARINHLEWTWDNTAWTYTSDHKRRRRPQRHSTLAKVTSPVEGQLNLICDIDEVRAGDVIVLSGAGPADGRWLVGTCRRSLFQVYSEITLVPALHPMTEDQLNVGGINSANPSTALPGPGATAGPLLIGPGGFVFPLPKGTAQTGPGGWSLDQGVDIMAAAHTPLVAVGAGTIVLHGIGGFGSDAPVLRLDSGNNVFVYYGHAGPGNRLPVGTHVSAGQIISEVGAGRVGISTGPHLEIGFCNSGGTPVPGTASQMKAKLQSAFGQ